VPDDIAAHPLPNSRASSPRVINRKYAIAERTGFSVHDSGFA
jgi:hypothetical protein